MNVAALLDVLMLRTASSIGQSLRYYWPSRANQNEGNALGEANLVTHFAHACLQQGFVVYPEAACDTRRGGRLDLLAFWPEHGLQIRTQAKRLYSAEKAREIVQDAEKTRGFGLNQTDNADAAILCPQEVVALYLAVTHHEAIAVNWMSLEHPPAASPQLAELLRGCDGQRWALPIEVWGGRVARPWLLYAWHSL